MTLEINDPETDRLAQLVAAEKGVDVEEAVRLALTHELERTARPAEDQLHDRMKRVWKMLDDAAGEGGQPADKRFFDELSGC